jgi:hypothetical protein
MIQVRYNIFETNSSSCHKLIVPFEQSFTVPKSVRLTKGYTNGIDFLMDELEDTYVADAWIRLLYASGVEEIIYNGSNDSIRHAIEINKGVTEFGDLPWLPTSGGRLPRQVYLLILFGENTQYLEHAYSDEKEPEEKDGQHFVFTW